MGKDLSYGLFLAGLDSGKHSWAATIPKPRDRHSELCMCFSARLKHVDGPGQRPWELGPASAGEAELSIRFCFVCSPSVSFMPKGCTFVLHHLCILLRRKQAFATSQPEKGLSPPCNQRLHERNLSPLWLLDLGGLHRRCLVWVPSSFGACFAFCSSLPFHQTQQKEWQNVRM